MTRKGLVVTDNELRGRLLEKYYQRRKERLIGLVPSDFDGQLDAHDILNGAGQLADCGLIHWRPNRGLGGIGGGMGTITATGVDVVESRVPAPIEILWSPDRERHASAASVVSAVASGASVGVAIERLAQAIDDSDASAAHKQAATLLLRAFQEHPLVCNIAQCAVESGNGRRPTSEFEAVSETMNESRGGRASARGR
jgi:hypothetical protein